jgi:hypothetical protein
MLQRTLSVAAFGLLLSACTSSGGRPSVQSGASQPTYAAHYAESVAATNKAVVDHEAEQRQLDASYAARIDELKKPDWDRVLEIVDKAEASGKSAGYAEAHGEGAAVRTFWVDEHDAISNKVAGSAQYTAKQGGCTAEVGGAASYALKDSMDKSLEKRLRARNDASMVLERYGASLGKENTAVLEKLADDVAQGSYLANVDLVDQRERLKARLAERSAVASTIERSINEERSFQAEPGRTDADRKASEERIASLQRGRVDLDRNGAQGDEILKVIDSHIDSVKKSHEEAIGALRAKIAEKKRAAPGAPRTNG